MHKRFSAGGIRLAVLFMGVMAFSGCQKNTIKGDMVSASLEANYKQDCSLDELFACLDEGGSGLPYAYARIFITVSAPGSEETEDSSEDADYSLRQDTINMEGTADITWQIFETAEEFQAYFAAQEKEESILPQEESGYAIELAYYQYRLDGDIHASDINRFLKEKYDDDENPIYAVVLSDEQPQDSYGFSQFGMREMVVVKDNVLYGIECKGTAEGIETDDAAGLLMAYSTQKQNVKYFSGWVMSDETLYWVDHNERVSSLDNPTRSFTEVKGIDSTWDGALYMENFALLKEADYQIQLCEEGPMLQLHFEFTKDIPQGVYETYLLNGFCTDEAYKMTVTDMDTNELLQTKDVEMSIEMPDMITFTDLDRDGYLDMQIDKPTHWNGERALVDEYARQSFLVWNPEEKIFETKSEREIAQSLAKVQEEEANYTEYVVQPGDTLWGISRKLYGTGTRYTEIERENADVLFDHKYLMPGMVLRIS